VVLGRTGNKPMEVRKFCGRGKKKGKGKRRSSQGQWAEGRPTEKTKRAGGSARWRVCCQKVRIPRRMTLEEICKKTTAWWGILPDL